MGIMDNVTAVPGTERPESDLGDYDDNNGDDEEATRILKNLVGHLLWISPDIQSLPLNLSAIVAMFEQLTDRQLQVLYNATKTSSQEELVQVLSSIIMQPRQFEESLMEFQEFRIQKILLLYLPPVLIFLGTLGNLFSFIVLRRKPMVKVSSYLYLAVLAIIDTLVLYNGLLRIWIVELVGLDYQGAGDWVCKLTVAFGYVSSDLSVWLIIAVTVERYIVVCFPFLASSMCNVSRARKVIVFLFLLMLSINVHFLWTAEIVEEEGQNICRGGEQFKQLVEEIWPWVDTLIYSFLPFVTIMFLNVLIIREIAGAQTSRVHLAASESETTCSANAMSRSGSTVRRAAACEGSRLTALLLTVSFTFLLLTLPNNIALIVSRFWNQKYEKRADQLSFEEKRLAVHGMAQFKLIMTVTELLMYTNHSINFFLYCATGNKFRQQFFDLFRCLQHPDRALAHNIHTATSHSMRKTSQTVMVVLGSSELTQVNRGAGIQSDSGSSSEGSGSKKREENLLLKDCKLTVSPNKACASDASFENIDAVDSTGTEYTLPSCNGYSEHSIFKIPEKTGISVEGSNKFNNTFMTYPGYKVSCGFYNRSHDASGTNFHNCSQRERNTFASVSPCKIYQSRKNHRHLDKSKHRNVGSGNKVNSKGNEYFLLKPSMHWHNSVTLS